MTRICIQCCERFETRVAAALHEFPSQRVSYNDAGPGRPKKIKTVDVTIPLRKHVVFPLTGRGA